jgi:hypothetical protein
MSTYRSTERNQTIALESEQIGADRIIGQPEGRGQLIDSFYTSPQLEHYPPARAFEKLVI